MSLQLFKPTSIVLDIVHMYCNYDIVEKFKKLPINEKGIST